MSTIENAPNIPDCFYRIGVKALILDDEKRFLLQLENNGFWEFPGGGLDFGENYKECLAREIREEMGLDVISINERPSYFLTTLHSSGQYWVCNVLYETKVKDLNFTPSDECIELKFFTKEEAVKQNVFHNVVEFAKMYNPDNHQLN
jgi:8-oxo-dGTP pyrophosphatase MutT (NUDIX family)